MQPLRMLGLAAMAALALMALAGAGTASATVLCKNNLNTANCSETLGVGTELKASSTTALVIKTEYKKIECPKSSFIGKVTNGGGNNATVIGNIETLTFNECNCELKILNRGSFEIHFVPGTDNGTFTDEGQEVTTNCSTGFGIIHCIYKTENNHNKLGTLTGGNPAKLPENIDIPRLETHALCVNEGNWSTNYEFTAPNPLYVAAA
ncbi:MAG TPA: hypothetical protein VFJ65_01955 [Solirubrobacterales bacterium]|nr:hypothetical protein [Solirubrobacterales bacterium]